MDEYGHQYPKNVNQKNGSNFLGQDKGAIGAQVNWPEGNIRRITRKIKNNKGKLTNENEK